MESDYLKERRRKMLGTKKMAKPENKPPKIRPFTKKREKKQREYRKLVKELLKKDGRCEVRSPVCTKKAQGLHHITKRSVKNLMDLKNLKRCCNACNEFMEANTDWAIKHGFIISKFKK